MLGRSVFAVLIFAFLLVLIGGNSFAVNSTTQDISRLGIVIFHERPLFDHQAYSVVSAKMDNEIKSYYQEKVQIIPVKMDQQVFTDNYMDKFDKFIKELMQKHDLDYLIFGELHKENNQIEINCWDSNNHLIQTYLLYNGVIANGFLDFAAGLYLTNINYFSSFLGSSREY